MADNNTGMLQIPQGMLFPVYQNHKFYSTFLDLAEEEKVQLCSTEALKHWESVWLHPALCSF